MPQIIVKNLGKKYKRYANHWYRLAEVLSWGYYHCHEERWALRNINFTVGRGEAIGIVGQNGAGKSTLLKLLVGTTQPNEGSIQTTGRIAALLELGIGFHLDFTGRDNAVMACRMAGLNKDEIRHYMPEIERFSELGDYLDQPLRVYSTGMQMRLAFSAATVVRPEILIVDEALSVGDAYFQHKCVARIRSFQDEGTTLLFVSHDPAAVKTLCRRALLFDEGKLIQDGEPDNVLDYYNAIIAKRGKDETIQQIETQSGRTITRSGTGEASIVNVEMVNSSEQPARVYRVGEMAKIICQVRINNEIECPNVGILLRDRLGNDVFGTNSHHLNAETQQISAGHTFLAEFLMPLNLGVGNYSLSVALHPGWTHLENNYDWWDQCLVFQVIPGNSFDFIGIASLPVEVTLKKERADDRNPEQ